MNTVTPHTSAATAEPVASPNSGLQGCQTLQANGLWTGVAWVEGLHCGACTVELQTEAQRVPGLEAFELNPASALGQWRASNPQAIEAFQHRVRKLGYRLSAQQGADGNLALQQQRQSQRSSFLRTLVALLGMMQIMMYSAPEYVYSPSEIGHTETLLLRWAQWVLCLPLLLYSAQPFYRTAWRAARQGRWSVDQPIVLGLTLAFGYSTFQLPNLQAVMWFDCVAMLLSLLLASRWWLDRQTRAAVNYVLSLKPDLPQQVEVWQHAQWQLRPVATLHKGDEVRLASGQYSPVDVWLNSTHPPVWVDDSMRTGESVPRLAQVGEVVRAGARVHAGELVGQVVALASEGFLAQLGQSLQQALLAKPQRQAAIERWVPWVTTLSLSVAALASVSWWTFTADGHRAMAVLVAVLLVTCPCALALSWPLVRLFAVKVLAKQGLLVRNPDALEQAAKVQAVVFDKTGTLTAPGQHAAVQWQCTSDAPAHCAWTEAELLQLTLLMVNRSAHPLSRALVLTLLQHPQTSKAHTAWLCQSVVELPAQGISAQVVHTRTGATQVFRLGSALFCGAEAQPTAHSQVHVGWVQATGELLPVLRFDVPQPPALLDAGVLKQLRENTEVVLMSGDSMQAAHAWAPELHFDARWGEQSPQNKADWIAQSQSQGKQVLMCGDGLNDAVAFAQADVSVASANASHLTAQQADVVMLQAQPNAILDLLQVARSSQGLGQQNMAWAVLYNLLAVPLAAMGVLTPWMAAVGMGVSSLVVVINASRLLWQFKPTR